jgi:hypothetical protein
MPNAADECNSWSGALDPVVPANRGELPKKAAKIGKNGENDPGEGTECRARRFPRLQIGVCSAI